MASILSQQQIAQTAPDQRFDTRRVEAACGALAQWLGEFAAYPKLQRLLDLVRWFTPVLRVPILGLTFVLRHDEVREVLSRSKQFPVPWGWKMELVTAADGPGDVASRGGRNFVLGMPEPDCRYKQDYELLARAFPLSDVRPLVGALAAQATGETLDKWERSGGDKPFDAVRELALGVPVSLCETYYGIPIEDRSHFGYSTLAVSSFLFGTDFDADPAGSPSPGRRMALDAARDLRGTFQSAIERARAELAISTQPASPLHRMLMAENCDQSIDVDRVHVQLFGMVLGLVPTDVLAGGNILDTLLRRPEFMARACEAALADDDVRLWKCLRETLRFRNINFGPLRLAKEDFSLTGFDGRPVRIRKGEKVLACTQSAMFDPDRVKHPHLFDIDRPDEDYLVFGTGQHWCLGAYIAEAQITQMFKVLLRRYRVGRAPGAAGRVKRYGVFPMHMDILLKAR